LKKAFRIDGVASPDRVFIFSGGSYVWKTAAFSVNLAPVSFFAFAWLVFFTNSSASSNFEK